MEDSDAPAGAAGPTVHGTYDFWLGGEDNFAADRELARAIGARFPRIPVHVRAAREFHLRAGRWCAERGIARFVNTGIAAWMPGCRNVLDAAREVAPAATSACVCSGGESRASVRALGAASGLHAVLARAERPAEVLSAAPVAAMIAAGEPVGLALGLVLQFARPERAAAIVAAYAAALPPGSAVALSVALVDRSPQAGELAGMFTPCAVYRHTAQDVEGWLSGAGLKVVPPGACDVRALLGGVSAAGGAPPRAPGMTAGALGRKP